MTALHRIQCRWSDFDALGHTNNAVVITYLETGRDQFLREHGISAEKYVVRHSDVDFRAGIPHGTDEVRFNAEIASVGRTSITTREVLTDAQGTTFVQAEFVLVLWDPVAGVPRKVTTDEHRSLVNQSGGCNA